MGSKIDKAEGSQLASLNTISEFVMGLNYNKISCISEEEFNQKCFKEVENNIEEKKKEEKND